MRRTILAALVVANMAGASVCLAGDAMTFALDKDFIVASGKIERNSHDQFRAFLLRHGKLGNPWNTVMLLRSPGGDLSAGVELGRLIRNHQISVVAVELCASSCTYMFMGGVTRVVADQTRFGVHQFYFDAALNDPAKAQFTGSDLMMQQMQSGVLQDYAAEMGVDPGVVALAAKTPPTEMTFLSRQQILAFRLQNAPTDEPPPPSPDRDDDIPPPLMEQPALPQVAAAPQAPAPPTVPGSTGATSPAEELAPAPVPVPRMSDAERINERLIGAATYASMQFVGQVIAYGAADPATYADFISRAYGKNVSYYGKPRKLAYVLSDKAAYAKRWAWRSFVVDPNGWNVRCRPRGASCTVKGRLNWRVGRVQNEAVRKGRSTFTFEVVSPLETPRVIAETRKNMN